MDSLPAPSSCTFQKMIRSARQAKMHHQSMMVLLPQNVVCAIVLVFSGVSSCRSFHTSRYRQYPQYCWSTTTTHQQRRHLFPLVSTFVPSGPTSSFDTEGRFGNDYTLSVVEEGDLIDLARLTVEVFGTEVVRIGSSTSNNMNSIESMLLTPAVELVNGYSGLVAFAEVLAGLRSRTKDRRRLDIDPPDLKAIPARDAQIQRATSTSLLLAVGKQKKNKSSSSWQSEIIASVELRLQPCDGKIPFTLPFMDRMERRLARLVGIQTDKDLQPYLSNLCVDEKFRGQGLGKGLVAVVEDIASTQWGYSKLYLHVDPDNEAAFGLYKNRGYKEVKLRWKPAWAGSSSDIAYLVKSLDDSTTT